MGGDGERETAQEENLKKKKFLFSSFSDLRKSDRRFSSGVKAKLIYAMRATRRHQKSWSFDKFREVGVLSYLKLYFV